MNIQTEKWMLWNRDSSETKNWNVKNVFWADDIYCNETKQKIASKKTKYKFRWIPGQSIFHFVILFCCCYCCMFFFFALYCIFLFKYLIYKNFDYIQKHKIFHWIFGVATLLFDWKFVVFCCFYFYFILCNDISSSNKEAFDLYVRMDVIWSQSRVKFTLFSVKAVYDTYIYIYFKMSKLNYVCDWRIRICKARRIHTFNTIYCCIIFIIISLATKIIYQT